MACFCSLRTLQRLAKVSIGEACWSIYRIASTSSLPPGDGVLLEDFLLLDWLSNGMVVVLMSLPIHVYLGFIVASRLDTFPSQGP